VATSSERFGARASAVEGARERPQAIGIIAALVIGFSALFMLAGVPKVWELYLQHSDPVVGFIEELVYGGFVLLVILLGCLGVATGIGLFLLWRWARVSILIFSALLPYVFVMGVIFFLSDPTFFGPGDELSYVFGAAVVILVVGIWSLFYFNRMSVKRLFHARRKTPVAYS
jgi:hypothetical protein